MDKGDKIKKLQEERLVLSEYLEKVEKLIHLFEEPEYKVYGEQEIEADPYDQHGPEESGEEKEQVAPNRPFHSITVLEDPACQIHPSCLL